MGELKPMLISKIAWRFYTFKSNIRVLSFINRLTKLGIILGIAILIMTNAVINGFDKQLHDKFLNLIPQALVYTPNQQPFAEGEKLEQELKRFTNVEAISPLVSRTVLIENGPQKRVIQAFAVDPHNYAQVSSLGDYVQEQGGLQTLLSSSLDPQGQELLLPKAKILAQINGEQNFSEYLNAPSILLGKQLAQALQVEVGSFVRLYLFGDNNNLEQNFYFMVTGIVDSQGVFDKELALFNIYDASQIVEPSCTRSQVDAQGQITNASNCQLSPQEIANAFQIRLTNPDVLRITPYQGWLSDQALNYSSWGQIYPNIYHDIPMIKSLLNLGLIFVVTLAGFNVICAILIQIRDKKKSITSLQAVGLGRGQIHQIFVLYSLILSGHAVIIGILLGVLLSLALEFISHWLLSSGVEVISAANYFIDYIPVDLKVSNMLITATAIIAVSLLTAYLTSLLTNKNKVDIKYLA